MVTCRSTSHCHSVQECRGLSVFLLVVAFLFVWDRFFFQLHKNCNLASHPRVSCVDIRRCWSFLRNVLQCMRWVPDAIVLVPPGGVRGMGRVLSGVTRWLSLIVLLTLLSSALPPA